MGIVENYRVYLLGSSEDAYLNLGLFDNFFADLAMARTGWGMVQGSARPSSESVIEISTSELTPPPA